MQKTSIDRQLQDVKKQQGAIDTHSIYCMFHPSVRRQRVSVDR